MSASATTTTGPARLPAVLCPVDLAAVPEGFEAGVGVPVTTLRVPSALSVEMMTAALSRLGCLGPADLATPQLVRVHVGATVLYCGVFAVEAAAREVPAGVEQADWDAFCRRAVLGMLAAGR